MRLTLAALALLASIASITTASAWTTCRWVGNTYYCNDSSGGHYSCRMVGNTTYCN